MHALDVSSRGLIFAGRQHADPMGKKSYTCPRSSGFGEIYACPVLSCGVSNRMKMNFYPEWGQEPVRLIYANPTFFGLTASKSVF